MHREKNWFLEQIWCKKNVLRTQKLILRTNFAKVGPINGFFKNAMITKVQKNKVDRWQN